MSYFDAEDLAEFTDVVREASPDSIVISRQNGVTTDGHGGTIPDWQTVVTVFGKIMQRDSQPSERVIGGQFQSEFTVEITVPTGTDVTDNDRCTVAGQVYEIIGLAPRRSFEVRRRIIARAMS